jgi:hypothetical protein
VPKETLVKVTRAEPGGLGGQGRISRRRLGDLWIATAGRVAGDGRR